MTEDYWQKFRKNKIESQSGFQVEVESELKRKFKNEKSPQEMMLLCKTDNNFWKQYRMSESLDDDSVAMVMCKDQGCEMMYCQALTFSKEARNKEIDTFGCSDQFNKYRECYIKEKRKFNSLVKEEDWRNDGKIIPEYLKKYLLIQKESSMKTTTNEIVEKSQNELLDMIKNNTLSNNQIEMSNSKTSNGSNGYL